MKITAKKRNFISGLWFTSKLRNSEPNLVIKYTEHGSYWNKYYFTIGKYSFDSINGMDHIEPLPGMEKLSYEDVLTLLND